jgi:hypothetical protein
MSQRNRSVHWQVEGQGVMLGLRRQVGSCRRSSDANMTSGAVYGLGRPMRNFGQAKTASSICTVEWMYSRAGYMVETADLTDMPRREQTMPTPGNALRPRGRSGPVTAGHPLVPGPPHNHHPSPTDTTGPYPRTR